MMLLSINFLNKNKMKVLLLLFLLVLAQILGSKGCFMEEKKALLNIKAFFNEYSYNESTPGYRLSSWVHDPNSDCCGWNRVTCDPLSGHVTELQLQNLQLPTVDDVPIDLSLFQTFEELRSLNLSNERLETSDREIGHFGSLIHSEVLANLSNLEVLILRDNYLGQTLPLQGLCRLKKIRVLDLSDNHFEGRLPKCIGNLTTLQALDLTNNFLSGEIPTSVIASLPNLEYLSLAFNYFEGLFTLSSFTNNSKLKVLALEMRENADNMLQVDTEGEGDLPWVPSFQLEVLHIPNCKLNAPRHNLPSFISYQHELQYLDLSNNSLVGQFPNWLLVNKTKLKTLILRHNSFTGPFELPPNMDLLPLPLYDLDLAHNKIVAKLPEDIGQIFSNLKNLNLSSNGFYGTIPASLGNMSNLFALDLSRNKYSGEVPKTLWSGCSSLEYLLLSNNNLWGQLFPSPLNLSLLGILLMDDNFFNGTLQHGAILQLPELEVLGISNNKLWGMIPGFIGNFSNLNVINLSGNNFTGTLPRELCKLNIYHMHLSHNKLSGSIPACYLNFKYLHSLHLRSNDLNGSIPQLRKTGSFIASLDLTDNNLSGTIPIWIDKRVDFLRALLLGGNYLQGPIPNRLCQLTNINFLDLSRNNFTGNIPGCFSKFSFGGGQTEKYFVYGGDIGPSSFRYQYPHLHLVLRFQQNLNFFSSLPSGIEVDFRTKASLLSYKGDILMFMSGIDLSCNQLTGSIPRKIGYLASLLALNLSHNHLSGSIPESFHNLTEIESLDLSFNDLSGKIPPQLQDLNNLAVFNVSYNNLSGAVPDKGQFGSFDESSYTGNPYLSWKNSNRGTARPLPPPDTLASGNGEEDESMLDFTVFYWSFAASYVTVLVVLVTILWINPRWRRAWFYFIETCLFKCFHQILKDAFY